MKTFRFFKFRFIFLLLLLAINTAIASPPPQAHPAAKPQKFIEGRDYLAFPEKDASKIKALLPSARHKIVVVEFFSYGCPACFHLEPDLEKWLAKKPHDVQFERVPVEFQPAWKSYSKSYYIIQDLEKNNLTKIDRINKAVFNAIHIDNKDLSNPDAMADFLATQGIDKNKFLDLYHSSPAIDLKLAHGRKLINAAMIFQVPGIVINGQYKVDPSFTGSDNKQLLGIIDDLITPSKAAA